MGIPVFLHIGDRSGSEDHDKKSIQAVDSSKKKKVLRTCLWCAHPHTTPPVRLEFVNERAVTGHLEAFCTFECAAAYNEYCSEFRHDKNQSYTRLCEAFNEAKGTEFEVLKIAPSRLVLTMFGGHMSIIRFRKHATTCKVTLGDSPLVEEFVTTVHPTDAQDERTRSEMQKIIYSTTSTEEGV